jgi:hypothetical protein
MKNPRARNEMYARQEMKYARQKNETFFIHLPGHLIS